MRERVSITKNWMGGHNLFVVRDVDRGKIECADGFTWRQHDEGDLFDPSEGITKADDLIQSLMDRAWDAGFRPRGFSDIQNETAAIRGHLDDMRTIAFHQLKIK